MSHYKRLSGGRAVGYDESSGHEVMSELDTLEEFTDYLENHT